MTTQRPPFTKRPWILGLTILAIAFLTGCEVMPVALDQPIDVSIEGRVSDATTGAPLDSVIVVMWSGTVILDETVHVYVDTDAEGLYSVSHRFEDECPGNLRLSARHRTFEYQSEGVDVECTDGNRPVNFELVRSETVDAGSE